MFESLAYAMGTPQAGAAPASGQEMLMQFLPLIVMFVIFWFLLIRPQQKRAKAHKQMLAELKRGDHVMTSSGILGRILEIDDEQVLRLQFPFWHAGRGNDDGTVVAAETDIAITGGD